MISNRIYYRFKPHLPLPLRMGARRILARTQRRFHTDTWPINEAAARMPANWPGWPQGKKFAFVLTHDVEGPSGLAKCRQLMELEMEMGFRSSFNFIPEGDYAVAREFREELKQNGFEVGVHDLHHDGNLYQSRPVFAEKAKRINHYLAEWGASGFRSGFMLHNLEWLHDLNVSYDASTFDTDPFEPQPDGVGTIFPFWVPGPANGAGGRGYVELPYTLPQDSTLFLLLKETSPDIWKRKLDWIAGHGGMALVNVHPDYLRFPGEPASPSTFPVEFYKDFLQYALEKFGRFLWHTLPREVASRTLQYGRIPAPFTNEVERTVYQHSGHLSQPAEFVAPGSRQPISASLASCLTKDASFEPAEEKMVQGQSAGIIVPEPAVRINAQRLRGRCVAVVLYSEYLSDPRPQRATESLIREGATVDVICLQEGLKSPRYETRDGVRIFRVPLKHRRGSKLAYVYQYSSFILASFAFLTFRSFKRRYDLVHVHNMPDVLVFSALVPKVLGAKLVLDLHDPMPELMMTIFNLHSESRLVRLLRHLERWSIAFADLVLTPNAAFKKLFVSRSCPLNKLHIVMNSPNEEIFQFKPVSAKVPGRNPSGPFVILYHGSLVARHGLDFAVNAFELVRKSIPAATFLICGKSTPYLEEVMKSVEQRGLQQSVCYLGALNLQQIVKAIEQCDLGIIPNRRSVFTEINMPTRIFEYLALAKPVIAPATQGIQDYFSERDLIFFEPDNVSDLAQKIEHVFFHPDETRDIVERGQVIYRKHMWNNERTVFLGLVNDLLRSNHMR